MPLYILLILVIGGIGGIALALHLLGLSRVPPLTKERVRSEWQRHFPGDHVITLALTRNGRAARVLTDQGRGILWQFGADTVARHLVRVDANVRGDRLTLRLHDYTAPGVAFDLDPDEQRDWANWLAET